MLATNEGHSPHKPVSSTPHHAHRRYYCLLVLFRWRGTATDSVPCLTAGGRGCGTECLPQRNRIAEISLNRYGPMDVPSKAQSLKRGKRQTVECEFPPFPNADKLPADRSQRHGSEEPEGLIYLLPISQPADRAPPFTV